MKSRSVLAVGVFVLVLGAASTAWACTYLPTVVGLSSSSAPPGSTVEVYGQGVGLAGVPIELRWNSVEGPVVGTATTQQGPNRATFSATMTIPDVAPGVYVVLAMDATGQSAEPTRTTFQVTPSPGAQGLTAGLGSEPALNEPARFDSPSSTDSSDLGLVVGLSMLGFGTAALLAGFVVIAGTRRSRVSVSRETSSF